MNTGSLFRAVYLSPFLLTNCSDAEAIGHAGNSNQPNIIFVLIDDVSANELNCYNGPGINTPRFDKMANEGVVFATGYSQPLCGPSRATLLTGKYAGKNHHYSNAVNPKTSIHTTHTTMGRAMRDAGYRTGWFGKQHIDRYLNPSDFGFDYYVVDKYWNGYTGTSQGLEPNDATRRGMYGAHWYWHPGLIANGKGIPTGPDDFGPEIELDSLLAFLDEKSEKPFFCYWPTNLPHHEYNGNTKTWFRPDVPEYDWNGNRTGKRIPGTMKSNLEFVDQALGRIFDKLAETNQINNTIIFLAGDNGTAGYGKGKHESEIAVHVPFLVYGPGLVKKRGISDVLVDFTDLLPTFLDLAGYKTNYTSEMDGHSFAPYLSGEKFEPRQWISAQLDYARWIRTREWLLDGNGQLWYCGKESDERKFTNLSGSTKEEHLAKKKELEDLRDTHITEWDGKKPE
jgi:arylsulfatase A-like enzyme